MFHKREWHPLLLVLLLLEMCFFDFLIGNVVGTCSRKSLSVHLTENQFAVGKYFRKFMSVTQCSITVSQLIMMIILLIDLWPVPSVNQSVPTMKMTVGKIFPSLRNPGSHICCKFYSCNWYTRDHISRFTTSSFRHRDVVTKKGHVFGLTSWNARRAPWFSQGLLSRSGTLGYAQRFRIKNMCIHSLWPDWNKCIQYVFIPALIIYNATKSWSLRAAVCLGLPG